MDAGGKQGLLDLIHTREDMNGVRANGTPCLVVC